MRSIALFLFVICAFAFSAAQLPAQTTTPATADVDLPFELRAPWYNSDRTAITDQVTLRGTLHVSTRVWAANSTHIDRIAIFANAVDIYCTSETTGQRFRLDGAFSFDIRDPNVTFLPDGSFTLPQQQASLHLHKVDPEPADVNSDLNITANYSYPAAASFINQTIPVAPCTRRLAPDGSPSNVIACGGLAFSYYLIPVPYAYRVLANGNNCTPAVDTLCVVPDGATLFNGYAGDYRLPLIMDAKVPVSAGTGSYSVRLSWHCKTGDREAPVFPIGADEFQGCRPIYSFTEPITAYAVVTYQVYSFIGYNQPLQRLDLVVTEAPFTFHMLERPQDQPPAIQTFSVQAASRSTGRCELGLRCELQDGDVIFNGQAGDYDPPLYLHLTATDPEGDPIIVQWYCKSGSYFAPITDFGSGQYSCSPGYIYPDPILIYARVSDGNNVIWSQQRQLYMLEFIH